MTMTTETYNFSFPDLGILPSDIELLSGFTPGSSPHPFPDMINDELTEVENIINITVGYRKFTDLAIDINKRSIRIDDQIFHPGKYAIKQFINATSAAIFVCTAGPEISALATKKRAKGDQLAGYIIDIIGNVIVEKSVEKLRMEIEETTRKGGLYISSSFSPGYCDWDLTEQHKLFSLLPNEFCGIKLSPSSLMDPVKSLSGIFCTVPDFYKPENPCIRCRDNRCLYGKLRRLKKSQK
ncbi:MAG: vitamin B12 dependent-methionine synthase activation domain-containing protein [Prolixibacteraceae bacterium]|nr:vitamin B12 dependent-methionine synthase activation domain-containing protein [Prolixibacteraceae bacterium]